MALFDEIQVGAVALDVRKTSNASFNTTLPNYRDQPGNRRSASLVQRVEAEVLAQT